MFVAFKAGQSAFRRLGEALPLALYFFTAGQACTLTCVDLLWTAERWETTLHSHVETLKGGKWLLLVKE